MINIIQTIFKIAFKVIVQAIKITKLYILLIPVIIYLLIFEYVFPNAPVVISNIVGVIVIGISAVFWLLSAIQGLVRTIRKDASFSIFESLGELFDRAKESKSGVSKLRNKYMENGKTASKKMDELNGIFFGKQGNEYICRDFSNDQGHTCIIGGSGSGKSSCVVIPTAAYTTNHNTTRQFVIDVKNEISKAVIEKEQKEDRSTSNIIRFIPREPKSSWHYDPFWKIAKSDNIISDMKDIAVALIPSKGQDKSKYFYDGAQNLLCGALIYYYKKDYPFSKCIREIQKTPARTLIDNIMASNNDDAIMLVSQMAKIKDEELGSIATTMSNGIMTIATDSKLLEVLGMDRIDNTFSVADIEYKDIFLCIDVADVKKYSSVIGLITSQLVSFLCERKEGETKPIHLLLDEFPAYASSIGQERISDSFSILRSKRCVITICMQSLNQLAVDAFGGDEKRAKVILDSCPFLCVLQVNDTGGTGTYLADKIGKHDEKMKSYSRNSDAVGINKGMSANVSYAERYIVRPEELQYLTKQTNENPYGIAILFTPDGVTKVSKCPYYSEDKLYS